MATFFANRAIETAQAAKAAEAEETDRGDEYAGEFWFSKKSEPKSETAVSGLSASTQAILAALRGDKQQSKFKGSMASEGGRYSAHATLMNSFAASFRQACASGEC